MRGVVPVDSNLKKQIESSDLSVVITGFKEFEDKEFIQTAYTEWGASGLAAVWAESNTRDSIYNAFRRKETFATTGSRIKVRFFAGYDIENALNEADPIAFAYSRGVTMGSDILESDGRAPSFLVWALRAVSYTHLTLPTKA